MKYISGLILAVIIFCAGVCVNDAHAADSPFKDNENGTVTVVYEVEEDTTILILVENTSSKDKEALRYYYKWTEGENEVIIPLSEGAGKYKIRICKVRSDNKAVVLKSGEIEIEEETAEETFHNASVVVDYVVSDKVIKKAKSLTKKCTTDDEKVKKIYNYIIKNFSYDYELLDVKTKTSYYVPDLASTYSRKMGICYDISSVLAAMLRSVGIDARVVTGNTPNVKEYHAWNQVYDAEKEIWYTIDATYDMCKYKSGKKVSMIKEDSDYEDIVYTY